MTKHCKGTAKIRNDGVRERGPGRASFTSGIDRKPLSADDIETVYRQGFERTLRVFETMEKIAVGHPIQRRTRVSAERGKN